MTILLLPEKDNLFKLIWEPVKEILMTDRKDQTNIYMKEGELFYTGKIIINIIIFIRSEY